MVCIENPDPGDNRQIPALLERNRYFMILARVESNSRVHRAEVRRQSQLKATLTLTQVTINMSNTRSKRRLSIRTVFDKALNTVVDVLTHTSRT